MVEHAGTPWRLVLDYNAFAWVESLLDTGAADDPSYADICREVAEARLSARHARVLVLASALRHQPEATLEDAGDLLSADIGLVSRLFAAASPTPAEQDALKN